jgi:hypothetical protein
MKSADTAKSDTSANSTSDPSSSVSESPPMVIQDRLVAAMFLIVGFLFGMILLVELLSGLFR